MDYFNTLPSDIIFEIISNVLGDTKSITKIFEAVRTVRALYTARNVPKSMVQRIRDLVRIKLDLKPSIHTPPKQISACDGIIQLMYTDLISIYACWRYYIIGHEYYDSEVLFINAHGIVIHRIDTGIVLHMTNKYMAIAVDNKVEVYSSDRSDRVFKIGEISASANRDDVINMSESMYGLMVSIATQGKFHIYRFDETVGFKLLKTEDHDEGSECFLGHMKYYIQKTAKPYLDGQEHALKLKLCGSDVDLTNSIDSIRCDNSNGIDEIRIDRHGIVYFCETVNDCSNVLWYFDPISYLYDIIDSLSICSKSVVDLFTGKGLFPIHECAIDLDIPIIKGVTKKEDDSGYYIWLNSFNTHDRFKAMILEYLHSIHSDTNNLIDELAK